MGWKKFVQTTFGDKKKLRAYESIRCPYGTTCPSHIPFKNARRSKIKFIERISPYVHSYRCLHCGCKFNYDSADPNRFHESELPFKKNPSFIHRRY